ncbi:MAG: Gfo/Idh/MocA family oxidoreductase [Myxococcales bacterium]|nr:Gfo/Idh/MocA family oxidoreductase [Myxococcales bacterium]
MTTSPVRIGILGAARIAPFALISPARKLPQVRVVAVAARDGQRASAFAKKHGIEKAYAGYEALLADPEIDAVYNPLPNSLHARYTIAALQAGKHVLCEKPLTANADEAVEVAAVAERCGRVLMEAFHWRYHPMAQRMIEIVRSRKLGPLRRIETFMCIPLPMPNDIRYQLPLAGGAGMDVGSYTVSMLRHLSGEEPEVTQAQAWLKSPGVDRRIEAEVRLPSGATGHMTASLWSRTLLRIEARITCERGTLIARNPVAPQLWHRLLIYVDGLITRETFPKTATYLHQLQAFAAAIQEGRPILTGPQDSVANMRVIDAMYRKAGLQPRGYPQTATA